MKLVQIRDGELEIRWTWLPYWIVMNPKFKQELERELHDTVYLNGATEVDKDMYNLHQYVVRRIEELYPAFPGLGRYIEAIEFIADT